MEKNALYSVYTKEGSRKQGAQACDEGRTQEKRGKSEKEEKANKRKCEKKAEK